MPYQEPVGVKIKLSTNNVTLPDDYFTFINVSELRERGLSLQQAVEYAVQKSFDKEIEGQGLVFLYFDKYSDIEQMPSYETKYYLHGDEITQTQYDFLPEGEDIYVETEVITTHNVEWTKTLDLSRRNRLCFMYMMDDFTWNLQS